MVFGQQARAASKQQEMMLSMAKSIDRLSADTEKQHEELGHQQGDLHQHYLQLHQLQLQLQQQQKKMHQQQQDIDSIKKTLKATKKQQQKKLRKQQKDIYAIKKAKKASMEMKAMKTTTLKTSNTPTTNDVYKEVANITGLTVKATRILIWQLPRFLDLAIGHTKKHGSSKVANMLHLKHKTVHAQPGRKCVARGPFTKEPCENKGRRASKTIRASPTKLIKMVN